MNVQATRIEKLLKTPLVFFQTFGFKKKFWLISIVILFVLTIILGLGIRARQTFLAEQKKKTFSEGIKYFQKGKFNKAVSNFKKTTELDPKNAKAHLNLAQSYEAIGELEKAVKTYQTSLDLNPNQPEVLYNLSIIYKSQGKTKDAINGLEEAVKLNKSFIAARLILGNLYAEQGQSDKAKEQYQAVIDMKPFGLDLAEVQERIKSLK